MDKALQQTEMGLEVERLRREAVEATGEVASLGQQLEELSISFEHQRGRGSALREPILELFERAEREAYRRGWRDASPAASRGQGVGR